MGYSPGDHKEFDTTESRTQHRNRSVGFHHLLNKKENKNTHSFAYVYLGHLWRKDCSVLQRPSRLAWCPGQQGDPQARSQHCWLCG